MACGMAQETRSRLKFYHRTIFVIFLVSRVAVGQDFLRKLRFYRSDLYSVSAFETSYRQPVVTSSVTALYFISD